MTDEPLYLDDVLKPIDLATRLYQLHQEGWTWQVVANHLISEGYAIEYPRKTENHVD